MSTTSAWEVLFCPAGMDAATQSRSTPNGEQLVAHLGEGRPGTVCPDCSAVERLPDVGLQRRRTLAAGEVAPYTAVDWSVVTQSSPLAVSEVVRCCQVAPPSSER